MYVAHAIDICFRMYPGTIQVLSVASWVWKHDCLLPLLMTKDKAAINETYHQGYEELGPVYMEGG